MLVGLAGRVYPPFGKVDVGEERLR